MNKVINFNKNASAAMTGMTKVRVRNVNGELQVKPTNRVAGRDLAVLRNKKQAAPSFRVTVDAELVGSMTYFNLEARKYGWFALIAGEKPLPQGMPFAAGGSISER